LFIDESGHDRRQSPYEALAGVAIEDKQIWPLIQAVQALEVRHFGQRITHDDGGELELKARKLLKAKTYRLAGEAPAIPEEERTKLARECLAEGARARAAGRPAQVTFRQLAALAQAKLVFVSDVFAEMRNFGVRVFGSVVDVDSPGSTSTVLRKDYSYLFERYYNFLSERRSHGLVVFDELENTLSHVLVNQMRAYFVGTATGKTRARRIVPEPLFVHSDLTTLVQVADLVAYVVVFGVRVGSMVKPCREELRKLGRAVLRLRHSARVERRGREFKVRSLAVINDLRSRSEREQAVQEVDEEVE
jgi:hypothetical protein